MLEEMQSKIKILQNKFEKINRLTNTEEFLKLLEQKRELKISEEIILKDLKVCEETKKKFDKICSDADSATKKQESIVIENRTFFQIFLGILGLIGTIVVHLSNNIKDRENDKKRKELDDRLVQTLLKELKGEDFWSKSYNAIKSGVVSTGSGIVWVSKSSYNHTKSGIAWVSKSSYNYTKSGFNWSCSTIGNSGKAVYNWCRRKT